MENYDKKFLDLRRGKFDRKKIFTQMSIKHFSKKCECSKRKKKCKCTGIIDLQKLGDEKYISEIYDNGSFDAIYNICQSVTQSMKSRAGRDFEECFKLILNEIGFVENKDYAEQVPISEEGMILQRRIRNSHVIDFLIPAPLKFPMKLVEYKGEIISCKTSLRERFLQDRFIGNFTLISLEKKDSTKFKSVQVKDHELTDYLLKLKSDLKG